MYKIPKFQLIEVIVTLPVTGQLQPVNFGTQNYLQSLSGGKQVWIKAMKVYTSEILPKSPLTPQNNVINATDLANACLIISSYGRLNYNLVPLTDLFNNQNTTAPNQVFPWCPRDLTAVDWAQCQILFINPTVTPTPFSVVFGVAYDYQADEYDLEVGYVSKTFNNGRLAIHG